MRRSRHALLFWLAGSLGAGCAASIEGDGDEGVGPGAGSAPGVAGGASSGPGSTAAPGGGATGTGAAAPTPAPSGFAPAAMDVVPFEARIWRLTRVQYNNTVKDLLGDATAPANGFPAEAGGTGFSNAEGSLGMATEFMDPASRAAVRLAAEVVADANRAKTYLHACLATAAGFDDDACVKMFVAGFGRRAFRRPLSTAEESAYVGLYTKYKPALGGKTGVQLVVEAMLQSPHFLFRTELGDGKPDARGRVVLTKHEVATQLAYFLTGSTPDADLARAADDGSIMTRAELDKQARRLFATDRAKAVVWDFFRQMLSYDGVAAAVDEKKGTFARDLVAAKASLARETESFVRELIWNDDATFAKLLAASHTFVDSALAKIYGVADPGAGKTAKVMLDPKDRAGILTHPGLMVVLSHEDQTSPVQRGVFVSERLLCRELPQPPPGVDANPPRLDAAKTTRQRYEALTEQQGTVCAGCHKMLNAPGYALEHIDWLGRIRRDENKIPVNTAAEVVGAGDADGRYANVGELAQALAKSNEARTCMAKEMFRFAGGRMEGDSDKASIAEMVDAFGRSGWNLRELVLSHVATERFLTRRAN